MPVGRHPCARSAFTLVELVMVVCVLAIVAGVAVPQFANSLTRHRVDAAASRLIADIELAQRHARVSSDGLTINFDRTGPGYHLVGLPDVDRPTQDYRVALGTDPYDVVMARIDFGSDDALVFDAYGLPDRGGSIVLKAGRHAVTVMVEADTGRAHEVDRELTRDQVESLVGRPVHIYRASRSPTNVAPVPVPVPDTGDTDTPVDVSELTPDNVGPGAQDTVGNR